LHAKDRDLLESIQSFLGGVGVIYKDGEDAVRYQVSSLDDLAIIIEHFDKYPLITQKQADFELFKQVLELVQNKEHLTSEGLRKIVSIRASINLGLSEALTLAFPNVIPVSRPLIRGKKIENPG